jgi:hypothetical protein
MWRRRLRLNLSLNQAAAADVLHAHLTGSSRWPTTRTSAFP